jgi:uncharacterized protein YbjT (DUF2867 family)
MILVTGATGKQGGAVTRQLLSRGVKVRALVRDRRKPSAQVLAGQGVELVRGDLEDRASIEKALEGVSGVYSVQTFFEKGVESEASQGIALADAAKAAGVEHFVYSSVGGADGNTSIPHFESKWRVEEHIRKLGLPSTILRPVFFMENWGYQRDAILGGVLTMPLDPDRKLAQIAVEDIGVFAAIAFADPGKWIGRAVVLAGDDLSMLETARVFSEVLGRPVQYVQAPWERVRETQGEELTLMYKWFNTMGFNVDIAALRKEHTGLRTLKQELLAEAWGNPVSRSAKD